jgi:hypothetical protein
MRRWLILLFAVAGLGAAAGCRETTGVHVIARVGQLQFDELRVGVKVLASGSPDGGAGADQTLVDPSTRGRYTGPFAPGDQDVYVYLPDDVAGERVSCQVTANEAGAVVGEGAIDVTVAAHEMKDVEVFLSGGAGGADGTSGAAGASGGSGTTGAGGAAGTTGAGGTTGAAGTTGAGGTAGGGGAAGSPPPPPPPPMGGGGMGVGGDKGKGKNDGGDGKGSGNGNGDDAAVVCIAGVCL